MKSVLRVLCSLALVMFLIPAVPAVPAQAIEVGAEFTVDGLQYSALARDSSTGMQVVYVERLVDSAAIHEGVINIPDIVEYDGEQYDVRGVLEYAFKDCLELQELRIGDLTAEGSISAQAFDGCSNLKVIHLLGTGCFRTRNAAAAVFTGVPTGLKVIRHGEGNDYESLLSNGGGNAAKFPVGTELYYEVDFTVDDAVTPVFVKGNVITSEGSSMSSQTKNYDVITKVGDLCSLSAENIYSDAGAADPICTNTVPEFGKNKDAWSLSINGEQCAVTDAVMTCGTAIQVSSKNLTYATPTLESSVLRYTGTPVKLGLTVYAANGEVISNDLLSMECQLTSGGPIKYELVDEGTYTARIIGAFGGDLTGSCSIGFEIVDETATWTRVAGKDRYATVQSISTDATDLASTSGQTAPNSLVKVIVNPDDYAGCVIADSIAGLTGGTVLAVKKDAVPDSTAIALASASKATALVVGSTEYISDEVKDAVGDRVASVARVTGTATTASAMAAAALDFVDKVKDGTISLSLEGEFGSTALVLPSAASPAVFSALAWGYGVKAPVIFADENGTIDADSLAYLQRCSEAVVVGFSQAALAQMESQAPAVSMSLWYAGASEIASSGTYAARAVENGCSYDVTALASGDDYGILCAAAATCGLARGTLLLGDTDTGIVSQIEPLRNWISIGRVYGDRDWLGEDCLEEIVRIWETPDNDNLRFGKVVVNGTLSSTGSAVKPSITVTDMEGTVLKENEDYRVSYVDNATNRTVTAANLKDPGSYTVTVTGTYHSSTATDGSGITIITGKYFNSRSASFTIVLGKPAKVAGLKLTAGKKKLTAAWTAAANASTYQVAYKLSTAKKWTTKTVSKVKYTVSKLTSKKKYQVRVRAKNAAGYGAWSSTKSVKVK